MCYATQAQLGLAQTEIKVVEANACRPMHHLPSLANQRIVPRPAGHAAAGSVSLAYHPSDHHPCSSTGLMLINPSSIRLTTSGSTLLDGCERIQWSTSYILSQARLVQVRIRCLLYVNFRAMYSLHSKKCNSRFLKIQITLSLIKFILKTTNIYIFKFF